MKIGGRPSCALLTLAIIGGSGCIQRAHVNSTCAWYDEDPATFDSTVSAAPGHLMEDARLAEELAVRYGDAVRHGPTSLSAVRERRHNCLDRLFSRVAAIHGVSVSEVQSAALRRDLGVDIATVWLPMAMVVIVVARSTWRRFQDHLSGSSGWMVLATLALGSLVVGVAIVQGGELWANTVEMIRTGNMHGSMRGNRIPWVHHRRLMFMASLALFWLTALVCSLRQKPEAYSA